MAVEVLPTGATPTGQQRVLFSATGYMSDPLHKSYDVSPDGRRFAFTSGVPKLLGTKRTFRKYGESGLEISDLFQNLGTVADDVRISFA